MSKLLDRVKGFVKGITKDKKKLGITILLVVVVALFARGCTLSLQDRKARQKALEDANNTTSTTEDTGDSSLVTEESSDAYIKSMQPDLVKSYGKLPDGYLWDLDGDLLSLGDKSLSAEDVVYAYLNGLRTLDLSIAQKYSRDSYTISTYESYFDSTNASADYFDSFMRNMYKTALLSMQIQGVDDTSVFAENKEVFTVRVKMLDLTKKDFWEQDKEEIYKNLYIYSSDENDSTKGEMYLYNYVLGYYQSGKADMREVTFNLTVERYPDLDTGWLVSMDKDINDACCYTDGTLMVNYINNMYVNEGYNYVRKSRETEASNEANTN